MEIYVGNLSYGTTETALRNAFSGYGTVDRVQVISDKMSGRSKGFGFVTMNDNEEGRKAIEALDGSELDGRPLKINEARPREERPRGGGGFGGGGYGGGGGGGGGGQRREFRKGGRY